jgi:hypothetical protein
MIFLDGYPGQYSSESAKGLAHVDATILQAEVADSTLVIAAARAVPPPILG